MKIEKKIDRGSKEKLYVQIYSIIREKIEGGEWPSGLRIPPEDKLCRIYDVSKVTVREAIQELVMEGYLTRQQGKGTFVTYSLRHFGIGVRARLAEELFGEEVKAEKEIIEKRFRRLSKDVGELLTMEDEDVYYILLKKIVNDESYIEEIFIPPFVLQELETNELSGEPLYDLLGEKGRRKIFRVVQSVGITRVQKDIAGLLNLNEGARALLVGRLLIGADGNPVAYMRFVGGGEKNRFIMEFERMK